MASSMVSKEQYSSGAARFIACNNVLHAAIRGHLGKESLEGFQSARGGANSNNEKVFLLALKRRSRSSGTRRFPACFLS